MNEIAPEGQVWVCGACGKRSWDRYGFQKISHGWDESCMLNAFLCYEDKLVLRPESSLVIEVLEGGVVPRPEPEPVKKVSLPLDTNEETKKWWEDYNKEEKDAS